MLWNPLGALFEQLQDFADIDENGISPLGCCCAALKERFAGVQAYHLDSRIWLDISRGRIYLCAISEALGGQKAASVWVAKVSEVVKHRQLCKPTAIIGDGGVLSDADLGEARSAARTLQDASVYAV